MESNTTLKITEDFTQEVVQMYFSLCLQVELNPLDVIYKRTQEILKDGKRKADQLGNLRPEEGHMAVGFLGFLYA